MRGTKKAAARARNSATWLRGQEAGRRLSDRHSRAYVRGLIAGLSGCGDNPYQIVYDTRPRWYLPNPFVPLTDGMRTGEEPMRTFSDLLQLYAEQGRL
jgi:hypothetical protein